MPSFLVPALLVPFFLVVAAECEGRADGPGHGTTLHIIELFNLAFGGVPLTW